MRSWLGRAVRGGAVAAAALAALLGGPGARADLVPAPGQTCSACYALLIDLGGASQLASLADREAALSARGYEVLALERPASHRLHHQIDQLLRRRGAEPGARLVLWISGGVEAAEGGGLALRFAAPTPPSGAPAGSGVSGLDLRHLLRQLRASAAPETLLVLDAPIPGEAALPIAASPEAGASSRHLIVTQAAGGAPLGAVFEALMAQPAALGLEAARSGFAAVGRVGYLADQAPRPNTAPTAPTTGMLGGLGPGAGRIPVPDAGLLVGPGLEIGPRDFSGLGARCDQLAADPSDPASQGRGVPDDRLDGRSAVAACGPAMLAAPSQPRFAYQYARGLANLGRVQEALHWLVRAAELGHLPAIYAYGVVRLGDGRGAARAEAVAAIGQAAESLYPPAVHRFADLAEQGIPEADRRRAAALLRRAARARDNLAAFRLAEWLAKDPGRTEAMEIEAEGLYAQAARAGIEGARAGLDAMRQAVAKRKVGATAARCSELLTFDVMAIEDYLSLPVGQKWRPVVQRRVEQRLSGISRAQLLERCSPLVGETGADPALLAKMGYAMWKVGEVLEGREITLRSGEDWTDVVGRAASGGEPAGLYLEGLYRMLFMIRHLQEGKAADAGKRASGASRSFLAAHERGVAQAGYYYALINLNANFSGLPGFRPDPRRAVDVLARLAPRAPRAERMVCDVYLGAQKFAHLGHLRDPAGARRLRCF